jgi:hypothetical protein
MRSLSADLVVRPNASDRIWVPGVLHVLAAVATLPVFGGAACLGGMLMASLASFVVYLPLTALALNRGQPIGLEEAAPALPVRAQVMLLGLWTLTAWAGAALSAATMAR